MPWPHSTEHRPSASAAAKASHRRIAHLQAVSLHVVFGVGAERGRTGTTDTDRCGVSGRRRVTLLEEAKVSRAGGRRGWGWGGGQPCGSGSHEAAVAKRRRRHVVQARGGWGDALERLTTIAGGTPPPPGPPPPGPPLSQSGGGLAAPICPPWADRSSAHPRTSVQPKGQLINKPGSKSRQGR